jgi:hypothetical protein
MKVCTAEVLWWLQTLFVTTQVKIGIIIVFFFYDARPWGARFL